MDDHTAKTKHKYKAKEIGPYREKDRRKGERDKCYRRKGCVICNSTRQKYYKLYLTKPTRKGINVKCQYRIVVSKKKLYYTMCFE